MPDNHVVPATAADRASFQYRIGRLEARFCERGDRGDNHPTFYPEIVLWWTAEAMAEAKVPGPTCHTVAYWTWRDGIFELHFVGDRPYSLDEDQRKAFWLLAEGAERFANEVARRDW